MYSAFLFPLIFAIVNCEIATLIPSPIAVGRCQNSALQAETTISFDGTLTTIKSGDIGVSPGTSITGNYQQLAGAAHHNDQYAQDCTTDMQAAYKQAQSQTCTNPIVSDLSEKTLTPGVYCTSSGAFTISAGTLTLPNCSILASVRANGICRKQKIGCGTF